MNYTVKQGDTISRIALNVLGNMQLWPKIAAMNAIAAPYRIYPGQQLQLPSNASTSIQPAGVQPILMPIPASMPNSGFLKWKNWISANKWLLVGGIILLAVAIWPPQSKKKSGSGSGKKRRDL